MEVILTFAYCLLFLYIIRKTKFFQTGLDTKWLPGIFFLMKCVAGIFLGLLYTYYYTNHEDADSFKFFTDSKIIFDTLTTRPYDFFRMFTGIDGKAPDLFHYYADMNSWLNTSPLFNDNRTIVRVNTFFRFFSLGHYYVHVIFLNFISFTGLFCLYKTFVEFCRDKKIELMFLIFCLPSVCFWGSGLLKDGLLLGGFGLLIYSFFLLMKKGFSIRRFSGFVFSLIVLAFTKSYVIALLLPGLFAWWISRRFTSNRKIAITFIAIYTIYFATAFNLYRFFPDYNTAALLYYKQRNFIEMGSWHAATMISPPEYISSGISIMKAVPHAFSNVMLRPFISDVHGNPMILLSALENMLIILLLVLCMISFKAKGKKTEGIILLSAIFVLILFTLIGLITPILGAIVRYRIVALPGLMFILVYYYDREKLVSVLPFLRKTKLKN